MAFGANSNDPRERRTFANAKLDRVSKGEIPLEEAWSAVAVASLTKKGSGSGLLKRYVKLMPPYDYEAGSRRYREEIEKATEAAAGLLIDKEVTCIAVTDAGVDSLEDVLSEVRDEVFQERLTAGYELSYGQLCTAVYGAAQLLEILVDERQPAIAA